MNAGTRPGVTSEEPAEIKRLKQEDAELRRALLTGLIRVLRPLGRATGEARLNCGFHAIRHHGQRAVLEKHYVPAAPARC